MSVGDSIEKFCSYFDREVDAIARLKHVEDDASDGIGNVVRYRKTLIISIIDTLAGIRFPPSTFPELARSNRARFLRFLAEHATWEEASLVSVPFLSSQLEAKGLDRSALAMHVAEKLSAYSTEMPIALRAVRLDEATGTLEQLAKSEAERVAIEHCSHPSILYRYRNHIVHESRIPGYAMEIYDEPTAHYCSYINDPHWRLAYPFLMFERIAKSSIESLRTYLTANNLDPYDSVLDTMRW